MNKRETEARTRTRSKASEPETVDATEEAVKKAVQFVRENRYYFFLGAIAVAIGVGLFFWRRHENWKELDLLARDFSQKREDPLRSDPFTDESQRIEALAEEQGRFFDDDLAQESVEDLEALARQAEGKELEPWILYHLGNRYYAGKDFDRAIHAYDRVLARLDDPDHLLVGMAERDRELAIQEAEHAKTASVTSEATMGEGPRLKFETTAGTFTVQLDRKAAPKGVEGLVALAEGGYYDGMAWYDSKEVPYPPRSSEHVPFGIGTGCPWGAGKGGPEGTFPKENLERPVTEGTVLLDLEGEESSRGRIWILREKSAESPGELADYLALHGSSMEDLDSARKKQSEYGERIAMEIDQLGIADQQQRFQEYFRRYGSGPDLTLAETTAQESESDHQREQALFQTFGEDLEAWRAARGTEVQGKYSIVGQVLEADRSVVRQIESGKHLILKVEVEEPETTPQE